MKQQAFGQYADPNKWARAENDFYASPPEAAHDLINHTSIPLHDYIFDAGAGTGVLGMPFHDLGYQVAGCDIVDRGAPRCLDVDICDFLTLPTLHDNTSTVIMNPPYKHAESFLRHAINLSREGGAVCLLARFGFIAAKKRANLLPPLAEMLIAGRYKMLPPGAVDKGHSGAVDFCWFTYIKGHSGPAHIARVP